MRTHGTGLMALFCLALAACGGGGGGAADTAAAESAARLSASSSVETSGSSDTAQQASGSPDSPAAAPATVQNGASTGATLPVSPAVSRDARRATAQPTGTPNDSSIPGGADMQCVFTHGGNLCAGRR